MAQNGFIPLRRGILEHLEQGRLTTFDAGVFVRILCEADRRTGIWWGSGGKLLALAKADCSLRKFQESLERLEGIGFVKRFRKPGERGNYPVLVNKFHCTDGALEGMRLNADSTTDWREPIYEEDIGERTDECTDAAPIREGRRRKIQRRRGAEQAPLIPEGFVFEGHHLQISTRQDGILAAAFPGVDRQAEYRKMDSWLEANPQRRTPKRKATGHWWFQRIKLERAVNSNSSGDGDIPTLADMIPKER